MTLPYLDSLPHKLPNIILDDLLESLGKKKRPWSSGPVYFETFNDPSFSLLLLWPRSRGSGGHALDSFLSRPRTLVTGTFHCELTTIDN